MNDDIHPLPLEQRMCFVWTICSPEHAVGTHQITVIINNAQMYWQLLLGSQASWKEYERTY